MIQHDVFKQVKASSLRLKIRCFEGHATEPASGLLSGTAQILSEFRQPRKEMQP